MSTPTDTPTTMVERLIPAEAAAEPTEFRVPRALMRRPYGGDRLLVVEGHVVVDTTPTDEVYREWVGPERYTATVRGWHRGAPVFAGMTPQQAVLRALGLERCPEHD